MAGTANGRGRAPAQNDVEPPMPAADPHGHPQPCSDDLRRLAVMLRRAAEGRRTYARRAPARNAEILHTEANTLDAAARLAEGDMRPMHSWLPSSQWTDDMLPGDRRTRPEQGKLTSMELGGDH